MNCPPLGALRPMPLRVWRDARSPLFIFLLLRMILCTYDSVYCGRMAGHLCVLSCDGPSSESLHGPVAKQRAYAHSLTGSMTSLQHTYTYSNTHSYPHSTPLDSFVLSSARYRKGKRTRHHAMPSRQDPPANLLHLSLPMMSFLLRDLALMCAEPSPTSYTPTSCIRITL